MRKKILASLLALVVVAAPVTAFANQQTVTIPVADVVAAAEVFTERHVNAQAYVGLRDVAEAFGATVGWIDATRTVTITINAAETLARFNAQFNQNIVLPVSGDFVLELQYDPTRIVGGGNLVVANGPAAGLRVMASLNDEGRFMLPVPAVGSDSAAVLAHLPVLLEGIHWGLVSLAAGSLMGVPAANVTPPAIVGNNVTITIN